MIQIVHLQYLQQILDQNTNMITMKNIFKNQNYVMYLLVII